MSGNYTLAQEREFRRLLDAGASAMEIAAALNKPLRSVTTKLGCLRRRLGAALGEPGRAPLRRRCLKCRHEFKPEHKGNFVCDDCKKTKAWKTGGDYTVAISEPTHGRVRSRIRGSPYVETPL